MKLPIYQVDAFTAVPFKGNPAAVVILSEERPADWMQSVAAEMNLSETAFLLKNEQGYSLRWFTPKVEVDLCGHATLASAHILFSAGLLGPEEEARFFTRSGLLTARLVSDNWIELNFPEKRITQVEPPAGLLAALAVSPVFVGSNKMDYLVEVADEEIVRGLRPDFNALINVPARGIIVTSAGKGGYDFISRFFAPAVGVNEDPVTGSAHCALAPYWARQLGKSELLAYQASPRGGVLRVAVKADRVYMAGQAVTIFAGELV